MAEISGGDKLEAALREISAKVSRASTLKVGFLEGSTEEDGTSIPMIAAIQNYGAPSRSIPPRPFFSNMVKTKSQEWGPALAGLLEANDYDAEKSLSILGEGIAGQLQQSIIDTFEPPLSPITVMLRAMRSVDQSLVVTGSTVGEAARRVAAGESTNGASTKPLVDSGRMLNAVKSVVT